jgi:hypothetical protein
LALRLLQSLDERLQLGQRVPEMPNVPKKRLPAQAAQIKKTKKKDTQFS